ncbi:hypothetical protein T492DRAFT_867565, partial [Pavlovales sp. CCMP2436]
DGSLGYWPLHSALDGASSANPPPRGPASMKLKRHAHEGRRGSSSFSLALLASGSDDGVVRLWDLLTDLPLAQFPAAGVPRAPAVLCLALLARGGGVRASGGSEHGEGGR